MKKFEQNKTYIVKKEGFFELHFLCTVVSLDSDPNKYARFILSKVAANEIEIQKCPIFFSILQDYFTNIYGNNIKIYLTDKNEAGGIREVAFSNYESYLWIDTNNVDK